MNGLEEIQEIIKNFIYEKQQMKQQIAEIESKRTQLAQERNEKKKINENSSNAYANYSGAEISELGKQIAELGNQSQELQNKLDSEFNGIKTQVNFRIDNLIAEKIRKIRKIEEERQELEERIKNQEERSQKYEIQKQEFYARFGRIPELSENALRENKIQEEETIANKARIEKVEIQIENAQEELEKLANAKREFKNGNWSALISETTDAVDEDNYVIEEITDEQIVEEVIEEQEIVEEAITLPLIAEENEQEETIQSIEEEPIEEINVEEFEPVEELKIEEFQPVEEIKVEEFEPVEELNVEPIEPIEELQVEEFQPVEEIKVEEFQPVEEIKVEEFETVEEKEPIREFKTFGVGDEEDDIDFAWQIQEDEEDNVEKIEPIVEETKVEESNIEQEPVDKIEEIARAIVEEIAAEQAKDIAKAEENVVEQTKNTDKAEEIEEKHENIQKIEEAEDKTTIEEKEEEIIAFEEKEEPKEPISIFGEKVVLLNINAKFENGEVAYKALASNGDEIKVYPRKLATGNLLLKDKENREELKEILINYAVAEYRTLDKKVIKKIDPTVCEILVRFAKKYNYDAQNLIYNYAMSFSKNEESEVEAIPTITYNLSYMEGTDLSKKEKETITKICKNARKNEKIDIIGCTTGLSKIKYIFKRTFAANNANALPEGKY